MEKYEQIKLVGEGSYGKVFKCRHKETGQVVAIKKFLETEEDPISRRTALREIRMLKKLNHDNLISLIEVFRRKKRFYMVFEYMNRTLLDEMEKPGGLTEPVVRQYIYQVVRGLNFCHENNIVHRDLKPENILVSDRGVVKLCDFGFARYVSLGGEPCTDYVATRWYRAPELLVGDTKYGRSVDIWAVGCIFYEMLTGDPLFAGDSDLDQLYLIRELLGPLKGKLAELMAKTLNDHTDLKRVNQANMQNNETNRRQSYYCTVEYRLETNLPQFQLPYTIDIMADCLRLDPHERTTSVQLIKHNYFHHDSFVDEYLPLLLDTIKIENQLNPLLSRPAECIDKGPASRRTSLVGATEWKITLQEGQNFFSTEESKKATHDAPQMIPIATRRSTEDVHTITLNLFRKKQMEYKKDVLPHTHLVKPVKNRLVVDHEGKFPCPKYQQRMPHDDFCLPELPGILGAKKKKQDDSFQDPFATQKRDFRESEMYSSVSPNQMNKI